MPEHHQILAVLYLPRNGPINNPETICDLPGPARPNSLPQDVDEELAGEPTQVSVRHAGMDEHVVEYVDQPGEAEGGPGDDDHGVADSGGELVFLTINIVDYQVVLLPRGLAVEQDQQARSLHPCRTCPNANFFARFDSS